MSKEVEKSAEETPEAASQPKKRLNLSGPILLGLVGLGAFVIGVAAFSFFLGVFSSQPPAAENRTGTTDSAAATTDHPASDSASSHSAASTPGEADPRNQELDSMERAIFGESGIRSAANMDEIVALAARHDTAHVTAKGPAPPKSEFVTERAELDAQRKELEAKKKELDAQEYRLKQLIAKTDQMESARIASLAKLYDGMKPQQVAPLITKLTDDQAVQVLLKMKAANAAKILEALTPEKAARISSKMITLSEEN